MDNCPKCRTSLRHHKTFSVCLYCGQQYPPGVKDLKENAHSSICYSCKMRKFSCIPVVIQINPQKEHHEPLWTCFECREFWRHWDLGILLKKCSKCHKPLPVNDFYRKKGNSLQSWCKHCQAKDCKTDKHGNPRKKYPTNPEKLKEFRLKQRLRKYGLSTQDHQELIDKQKNVCAICHKPQNAKHRQLSIDHNHKTGAVRGLLCESCNTGLGLFKDKSYLLRRAARYIDSTDHMYR